MGFFTVNTSQVVTKLRHVIYFTCSRRHFDVAILAEGLNNILTTLLYLFSVTQIHLQASVVFIRGLSEDTTEDGLWNYLENTRRSGGGPVEELKITGNSARVKFESSEGKYIFCKDGRNAN